MNRLLIVLCALVILTGCATLGDGQVDLPKGALEFTRADLEAGQAIAKANGDVAAVNCTTALLAKLPPDGKVALATKGPFSAYIAGRQALRKFDQGIDEAVHLACAPLILDLEKRLVRLGVIVLPGGGIAGKLLGR